MSKVKIGKLEIDPRRNPAVLDTGSWNFAEACRQIDRVPDTVMQRIVSLDPIRPLDPGVDTVGDETVQVYVGSFARNSGSRWFLAKTLGDEQRVLLEIPEQGGDFRISENPHVRVLANGTTLRVHPTDALTLERYFRFVNPEKGPQLLGGVPRLGIGARHTTYIWPGSIQAMHRGSFSANLIQNSVRELHRLETLIDGTPSSENYLFSFGRIQAGHAGSTFEGLWVGGVLEALASNTMPRYGADADHIQVKRGAGGLDVAKQYLSASRFYSFYTLDVSDILNYSALWQRSSVETIRMFESAIPDASYRRDILAYHARQRWLFGQNYRLDDAQIGRFVAKYWDALGAIEEMVTYLRSIRDGQPFDLEISIDETPAEIPTFDAATSEAELLFLMLEIRRRSLPVSHLAPNFGIEKGTDYRGPDGLAGMEMRFHNLYLLASELGFFLDCHSGDDLSRATRRAVGRATAGRVHFKLSPSLQVLYAEALYDYYPDTFLWWWNDTMSWVQREAEAGSAFAIQCLKDYERSDTPQPHPNHALFEHYNFASVGRRSADGSFENRERFYNLPEEFDAEMSHRVMETLLEAAEDVFDHPPVQE